MRLRAIGRWVNDDNKPISIVKVSEKSGVLDAVIVKQMEGAHGKYCSKCRGDLKDEPIVGMTIISGLKASGPNDWSGGTILVPEKGKSYDCSLSVSSKDELDVKVGSDFFSKTFKWKRSDYTPKK